MQTTDRDALYYLSLSYIRLHYFDDAEESIKQFISLYPNTSHTHMLRGEFLLGTKKYNEAIPYFEQCISMEPKNGMYYYKLAYAIVEGIDLKKAARFFPKQTLKPAFVASMQRAIDYLHLANEYNPDYPEIFLLMAKCYDLLYLPDKAFNYYRKVISIDPTSAIAQQAVGFFHLCYGEFKKAKFHYEQALIHDPNHYLTLERQKKLTTYENDLKEYLDNQIQYWSYVCKANPNHAEYLLRVVELKLSQSKQPPIKELKRYLKLKPEDWEMQITYGEELYKIKRYGKAERHFKKLQQLNPADQEVNKWLHNLSNFNWVTKYVFSSLRSIAYHTVAKLVLFFIYFILFSIDFIACFFSKGKRKTSIYLVQFNLLKRKYKHPILFTKRRRKEIQEPLPFKNEIIAIFSQFQGEASYVGTIPDQIQKTIRKKFKIPPSDEIFAFIDFTILGRGKNGFAIGEKGLYFKEISDEPVFIPWKEFVDLNDIKVVRNSIEGTLPFILCIIGLNADNYNLIINDHQFFILTPIISHEDIEKLIIQFRDCAKNHYKFHR